MREHLKDYIDQSKTPEVRGLRILLEYFYATEIFEKITQNKTRIISVFGSARTKPDSEEYHFAHELGSLLYKSGFAVVTGASRGIMQAANQGVADAIAAQIVRQRKSSGVEAAIKSPLYKRLLSQHSVGLSISLPMEAENNPFVGVNATFHYFMVRKFFFGTLSSGFIACEGGWGTRDELYEILTLVQTGKAPVMPIVYLSSDPSHLEKDMRHALRKKYINAEDLDLLHLVRTPEQAAKEIQNFYRRIDGIFYDAEAVRIVFKSPLPAARRKRVEKVLGSHYLSSLVVEWSGNQLILPHYAPQSYGTLRKAIDVINQS